MKTLPTEPALAAQSYDRTALLSLSDQIIASLRFSHADKSKARNACQHLADALGRCRGRSNSGGAISKNQFGLHG
jgi:hypothetical protein